VTYLQDYCFLRLRPDVMAWGERVAAADPLDLSPVAARVWVLGAYAAWMAGDLEEAAARSERALRVAERSGGDVPAQVMSMAGNIELFQGRLVPAATWYRRAVDAAGDDAAQRLVSLATELLALSYADDPTAIDQADRLVQQVGDALTPYAAFVWYCAAEVESRHDHARARTRYARSVEVAEATHASFVRGLAAAAMASIDSCLDDPSPAVAEYLRVVDHWRRSGMWSTQWTMLRSIATLLERMGLARDAARLEGAVRATGSGHRIFGADAQALDDLSARLRRALGDAAYEAARGEGARLDDDAAVEHALRSLRTLQSGDSG
jgi:hypothetical protein